MECFERLWGPETALRLDRLRAPHSHSSVRVNTLRQSPIAAQTLLASELARDVQLSLLPDLLTISNNDPEVRSPLATAALVDIPCAEAVLRGADIFAPGVLASTCACKIHAVQAGETISLYASFEPQLRGTKLDSVPRESVFLGNGIARMSRSEIFSCTKGLAVSMTEGVYSCPRLHGLHPDWLFAQHLPSALASHVLAPGPEDRVLDMCAAPGGKTTHLSTLMGNSGSIIALERSKARSQVLAENLVRWGAQNVEVRTMDASKASRVFPTGSFSKVLLDAPCSGLGQRPRLRPNLQVDIAAFASFQRKLLQEAVCLLAPEGHLVYSTCTISPQGVIYAENEENVAWALENLPLELRKQEPSMGVNCGPESRCQFFDPSEWDLGFFLARVLGC